MFPRRTGSPRWSLSDSVNVEVVGALYSTRVSIVITGAAQLIVGSIAAWQTADVPTAIITAAGVIVACLRGRQVLAGRRRLRADPPPNRVQVDRCKLHYALGTGFTSLILGLFAARSLMLDDAICSMMALGIGFAFGAGIVARLSMVPLVALADLAAIGLPPTIAAFARLDAAHIGIALLVTIYLVGSFEMVRLMFNSTVNHISLKHKFEQLARIDPMTGLLNRSVLTTDLARMIAARGERIVAIHAIDLDHFKAANDRFGHPVGDALLREVALRLTSLKAPGDLLIRMGGDEFVLAQQSVRAHAEAEAMAKRIYQTVSAPYCIEGHDIVIGTSIGVALSGDDGADVEAMLSRSDKALYQAKTWRGGYVFARDLPAAGQAAEPRRPALFGAAETAAPRDAARELSVA